jgi:hypothetical protein
LTYITYNIPPFGGCQRLKRYINKQRGDIIAIFSESGPLTYIKGPELNTEVVLFTRWSVFNVSDEDFR